MRGSNTRMCRAPTCLGQPMVLDHLLFQPDSAPVRQSYMPKVPHMLNLIRRRAGRRVENTP